MRFTFLSPDDRRWNSFLSRTRHDVYHIPGYVNLLGLERRASACVCFGESIHGVLFIPLLLDALPADLGLPEGLLDARSPDGYPGPLFEGEPTGINPALHALTAFLRSKRVVTCFIRTHPLLGVEPTAFEEIGTVVDRGRTVQVVLDSPYEKIVARMRQGHRYEIRKAYESGYRVVFDHWELLPELVSFYRSLMERVGAAEPYRFSDRYFEHYRESIGESAHLASVLSEDGAPAAAALFTLCSGIVQYHLAASDPRFDKDAVQKLIIDGLIRYGLRHGAETVHLGGGVGSRSDSLLHFKMGFSRSRLTYHTIHLVPDPTANLAAESAWSGLSGKEPAKSDFFPVYRTPFESTG